MNTLVTVVLLVSAVSARSVNICDGSRKVMWKADPSDCSVFYMCFGESQDKFQCPVNTVYNEDIRTCVWKGSVEDKCTKSEHLSITEKCNRSQAVFLPHEESCSKYVDCTTNSVQECYYPFLFDDSTKRCTPPTIAKCGGRTVPIDPCDYVENECESSMGCIPCRVRFPSCKGLADGLNTWPEREGSPYFVVCKDERVVYHDQCDFEHKKEIFHPQKRACLTM